MHVYKFLKFAFEKLKTVVLQTAEKSLTGELKTGVKGEVIPHCKIAKEGRSTDKSVILQRAKNRNSLPIFYFLFCKKSIVKIIILALEVLALLDF